MGHFKEIPHIFELSCSADALEADANLLSMVLFRLSDDVILASLNMASRECSTSAVFSSCVIEETDVRKSSVKTLVMNLKEGETSRYGCEVSSMKSGERVTVAAWSVAITGKSESYFSLFVCLDVCPYIFLLYVRSWVYLYVC